MASSPAEAQPRRSAEFVESSVLEALVPADSAIDIEEELKSWDGSVEDENSSLLPPISERQALLFDELVSVYVVFRTPLIEESTLEAYLARLAINLEAFAFSTAPPPEPEAKPPPTKEVIFSETIKDTVKPVIIRYEEEASPHIYVIWKLDVFICRPRGRFHKPAIYFQPSASLKPAAKAKRVLDDEYLPSRVPTALNLLQSFESDPALAEVHPRLSALRISKIAPTAPVAKELVRPIRTGQRRLFRVLPALIWRMRYSKVQASLSDLFLIASLDLEVAHVTGCSIAINDVELALRNGSADPIANHVVRTSTTHRPGDQLTYLYKIRPDLAPDGTPLFGNDGHILILKVKANVLVSEDCQPKLVIEWRTPVDFAAEYNPDLVKAAHRISNPTAQPSKAHNPDALPTHDSHTQHGEEGQNKPINVTLTVSGPPQVHVGDTFRWDVFIVNRSEKTRKLAVLTVPKRKRDVDRHKSQSSISSAGGHRGDNKDLLANAVVDENIVYAKQKNARMEVAELVCLTTDVRIGHLASGACYTAELKFVALSPGVLSVDAVRIVDLASQEAVDIRDLPGIVAVEKAA